MSARADKGKRPMVIIGTSGSTDWKDTGDRRYWPVGASSGVDAPLTAEEHAVVQRLVEMTGGGWIGKAEETRRDDHEEME